VDPAGHEHALVLDDAAACASRIADNLGAMNRHTLATLAFAVVLLTSTIIALALDCGPSAGHFVIFKNDSGVVLDVRLVSHVGSTTDFRVAPAKTTKIGMARTSFPESVSAVDETGTVRFQATLMWEQLQADGWQVSLH
jgi:hypothetical protein